MTETPVVTVFLRSRGGVLLLRRSDEVDLYAGKWGAVSGHVEDAAPRDAALTEIEEETGLRSEEVTLVREGPSFSVEEEELNVRWVVHPFLFDCEARSVDPNWETAEMEWVAPTMILRRDTVPDLWRSYRRVAPSIVEIRDDTRHGSAYLSIRALEVLRNRAGRLATTNTSDIEDARARLTDTAHRLLEARPSMAALANRIHRVMHASQPDLLPSAVETNAHEGIARALQVDDEAAQNAAGVIRDQCVLTLSRSGTILTALRSASPPPTVFISESRPGREGTAVAETLSADGVDVIVVPDAALSTTLRRHPIEVVLVGADTIHPTGAIINKVGSRGLAQAARYEGIPFYATCAVDKISIEETTHFEDTDSRRVYDGARPLEVSSPRFDQTPPDLVTGGIITNRGIHEAKDLKTIAQDLARLRTWA